MPCRFGILSSMCYKISKLFQNDFILRVFVHIIFVIPCNWFNNQKDIKLKRRLIFMILPVTFAILHWCSYGFEMYNASRYWLSSESCPKIPTDTFILMCLLFLSGALTYSLAVTYFFNPNHHFYNTYTRLVPRKDFRPENSQKNIGPSENDWMVMYLFMFLGTADIVSMFMADINNVFFDFNGIKNFSTCKRNCSVKNCTEPNPNNCCHQNITDLYVDVYDTNVYLLFWALEGSVVFCCIFYIMCRDIVQHVIYIEHLILRDYYNWEFCKAQKLFNCLINYTEQVTGTLKIWFLLHTVIFLAIVVADLGTLIEFASSERDNLDIPKALWSQLSGCFLVAFKFSFPFLAASGVTSRYDLMLQKFNKKFNPKRYPESETFLNYCLRCNVGFNLCGIRLTFNIFIVTFLSSLIGLLKLYREFSTLKRH